MTRNLQGLISYGPDLRGQYIDGATDVDHILRGAKPADLPVRFATKLELVVSFWYCRAERRAAGATPGSGLDRPRIPDLAR